MKRERNFPGSFLLTILTAGRFVGHGSGITALSFLFSKRLEHVDVRIVYTYVPMEKFFSLAFV